MDASQKLQQKNAWQEAAAINLAKIDSLEHASDRADLLLETAMILETKLDDPAQAFPLVLRAFWEIPTRPQTIRELERLAELTSQWPDVHATAVAALEKTPGKTARIVLLLQIAGWCASKLGRPDQAVDCYSQVLQIDPANIDAYRNLADLYGTSQQWGDLAAALEAATSSCKDPNEAKQFLFVRGRVLEQHLGDLEGAAASYERACEIDPGYRNALDALDRIYAEGKRWWPLLAVLKRKIDAATEDPEKIALLMRKGALLATEAESPEEAVDAYNDILHLNRQYLPALEALENSYRSLGHPTKVRDLLEQQIAAAPLDEKRLERLVRLAKLLTETLWDPDRAASAWEKVLELAPADRAAHDSLIGIYRARRQFGPLAKLLKQAIQARGEEPSVKALYLELGQLLAGELGQAEEAEQAFNAVLRFEPDHIEALEGLASTLELAGKWEPAESALQQLLDRTNDGAAKEKILFRLGSLAAARKDNPRKAIDYFTRVQEANPRHLEALRALHGLYLESGALSEAVEVIASEYQLEESAQKQAALGAELGVLCQRQGREEPARLWFERALLVDPLNATAAREMAAIHLAEGSLDKAASLLEMLVRTGAAGDENAQRALLADLSRIRMELGETDKALEAAKKAHELDPTRLDSLRALGEELFRAERWEEARGIYEQLTAPQREGISSADRTRFLYERAVILRNLEEKRGAVDSLEKALAISPEHRPSLELLIRIRLDEKRYADVLNYQKQLAGFAGDEERFGILVAMGDLAADKLDDHAAAIEAYEEAIRINPEDRPALHKLLPHYQATDQWPQVVAIILRLIETETDPHRTARLYKSMGIVYRDKLDQAARCLDCFDEALDADPDDQDVFVALVNSLKKTEDWTGLAGCYRKMLSRLEGKNARDREIALWHALGELCFDKLKDYGAAAEAFEKAGALEPRNPQRQELLASCYVNLPGRSEEAIAEYRRLVSVDPDNVDYYRRLGGLLADRNRSDERWNLCAALVALGKADEKEREFYQGRPPKDRTRSTACVTGAQWGKSIAHPDDDPAIAELFSVITPAIVSQMEQPLKAHGLKKRDRVSPKDDAEAARIYYGAGHLLGLGATPDLYIKPGDSNPFNFTLTNPLLSVVGEGFLGIRSPAELRFVISQHLAYCRPGRPLRWIVNTTAELTLLLLAAMKLCVPGFQPPGGENALLNRCVDALKPRLSPGQIDAMRASAIALAARDTIPSIPRWIAGLEYTACRAALLLSGDLPGTALLVKSHHYGGAPSISEKVADLLAYGASREYAALCAELDKAH